MDDRMRQFWVGVVVLATLVIAATLAVWFGEIPTLLNHRYTIYIVFPEAPGVNKDTPIHKSGVLVGRVTDVQLNADRTVTVTARIEGDRSLFHDETCVITRDLLGEAKIEIVRGQGEEAGAAAIRPVRTESPGAPGEPGESGADASGKVEPGETLRGRVQASPVAAVADLQETLNRVAHSVNQASESFKIASDRLSRAADNFNQLLSHNREGLEEAIKRTNDTFDALGRVAKSMNNIIGDEKSQANLRDAIQELPKTLSGVRGAVNTMNSCLNDIQRFTGPFGEGAIDRVAHMDRAIVKLDVVMNEMEMFARAINNPSGTLGRLTKDPELYTHLTAAAQNVEELTQQLRPILNDARAFSDKIARHPELLGVRGALQTSSGIK